MLLSLYFTLHHRTEEATKQYETATQIQILLRTQMLVGIIAAERRWFTVELKEAARNKQGELPFARSKIY
jgi:hypothetical protein